MEISSVTFFPRHTRITVRFRHHLYSSHLPGLAGHLLTMLPSLREHFCMNRRGLSFEEELKETEMGHVFEHVALAVLALRGITTRGQTTWNWQRDPIGMFQVTIGTGKKLLVKEALVISQAIITNALFGPVLRFRLPTAPLTTKEPELPVYRYTPVGQSAPLLFAAEAREAVTTKPTR